MTELGLAEFLLARISEDEAVARAVTEPADMPTATLQPLSYGVSDRPKVAVAVTAHPARVLAECEAKRQLVESIDTLTGGEKAYAERLRHSDDQDHRYVIARDMLRWLALPYADHPDYREEWRP